MIRRKEGLTPLDQADGKVHFEAYTYIMEKLENKSTENKRGKTPFHVDAKRVLTIIFPVTSMA